METIYTIIAAAAICYCLYSWEKHRLSRPLRGDGLKEPVVGIFKNIKSLLESAPLSEESKNTRLTKAYDWLMYYQRTGFVNFDEEGFELTVKNGRKDYDEQRTVNICCAICFLLNYDKSFNYYSPLYNDYPPETYVYYKKLEKQLAGIYDYQMENNKYFPQVIIDGFECAKNAINEHSAYLKKQTKKPSRTRKKKVEITKAPSSDEDGNS